MRMSTEWTVRKTNAIRFSLLDLQGRGLFSGCNHTSSRTPRAHRKLPRREVASNPGCTTFQCLRSQTSSSEIYRYCLIAAVFPIPTACLKSPSPLRAQAPSQRTQEARSLVRVRLF
jgi:hypothetical protein